jgi:hypothetical protein
MDFSRRLVVDEKIVGRGVAVIEQSSRGIT